MKNPSLLAACKDEVAVCYPNLHFSVRDNTIYLSGSLPIMHEGKPIDRYSIEIEFPWSYPRGIPLVREVGGRIPRTADRHTYSTGEACLFLPLEVSAFYPEGTSLLSFLAGPVQSFFVSQSIFELTGEWPFGQRSHGAKGLEEYVLETTGLKDKGVVDQFIAIMQKEEIKGHWSCPCGSGKRIRYCHFQQVLTLHKNYQYYHLQYAWIKRKTH